jgi:hypothetical protein
MIFSIAQKEQVCDQCLCELLSLELSARRKVDDAFSGLV